MLKIQSFLIIFFLSGARFLLASYDLSSMVDIFKGCYVFSARVSIKDIEEGFFGYSKIHGGICGFSWKVKNCAFVIWALLLLITICFFVV